MNFTDQKPRMATKEDCEAHWSGNKKNFRCYLCGHKFQIGDQWRFVLATHKGQINFLVCKECDGEDVLERWLKIHEEIKKYWWRTK